MSAPETPQHSGRGNPAPTGALRQAASDLAGCLRFFSRIAVPRLPWEPAAHPVPDFRTMPRMLPVAGAIIGLVPASVLAACHALSLGAWPAAGFAVAALVLVTGGLHEDGLADTADGFGGGATVERRLEIMRDSRVGSFGATAIALSLMLRIVLIATLGERLPVLAAAVALIVTASFSRTAALIVIAVLPPARPSGASHAVGRPGSSTVLVAGIVAALIGAVACLGTGLRWPSAALAFLLAALAALGVARLARRRIGGQTGDVVGAAQQVAEVAALAGVLLATPL